jgi:hypothetical protein
MEKLLPVLKAAGMASCTVSLQSGSRRINREVFNRVFDRDLFLRTVWLCKAHGIPFFTDVITFNPYEEERDLQDTLEVLLDAQGAYGLGVNQLFVLPGAPLADKMARDGKTVIEPSRQALFNYYSRLFWIASVSPASVHVVRFVQSLSVFRRWPFLIPSDLVRWLSGPYNCCDRIYALSRAAAAWILRRTVARVWPGLIRFRRDQVT